MRGRIRVISAALFVFSLTPALLRGAPRASSLPSSGEESLSPALVTQLQMTLRRREGRAAALTHLLQRPSSTLTRLPEALLRLLEEIALTGTLPLAERYRALHCLRRARAPRPRLIQLLLDAQEGSGSGLRQQGRLLLARTLAESWRMLDARALLEPMLRAEDPELRASAAAAGAGAAATLCALLTDPWPAVVHAAIRGLKRAPPEEQSCLQSLFLHRASRRARLALQSAGESGWQGFLPPLRQAFAALQESAHAEGLRRDLLLVAMARLGEFQELEALITAQLSAEERPRALSPYFFQALAHLPEQERQRHLTRLSEGARSAETRARALQLRCEATPSMSAALISAARLPPPLRKTLTRRCLQSVRAAQREGARGEAAGLSEVTRSDPLPDPFADEEDEPEPELTLGDPWALPPAQGGSPASDPPEIGEE